MSNILAYAFDKLLKFIKIQIFRLQKLSKSKFLNSLRGRKTTPHYKFLPCILSQFNCTKNFQTWNTVQTLLTYLFLKNVNLFALYVLQYSNFSLFKEASGQLTLITLPSTIFIAVQSYFSLHVFRNVFVFVTYTINAHFYHKNFFFLLGRYDSNMIRKPPQMELWVTDTNQATN